MVAPKTIACTVPKKDLVIALPYLAKLSLQVPTRINRLMKNELAYCKIRVFFQAKRKSNDFFTFNSRISLFLRRCLQILVW